MIRLASVSLAIALLAAAATPAQACKIAVGDVVFAPGSTEISAEADANLVRWVGSPADGKKADLMVYFDPDEPDATTLQQARVEAVTARLAALGLRRENVQTAVQEASTIGPFIAVYPNPNFCSRLAAEPK